MGREMEAPASPGGALHTEVLVVAWGGVGITQRAWVLGSEVSSVSGHCGHKGAVVIPKPAARLPPLPCQDLLCGLSAAASPPRLSLDLIAGCCEVTAPAPLT